jgi:hypothetical protein
MTNGDHRRSDTSEAPARERAAPPKGADAALSALGDRDGPIFGELVVLAEEGCRVQCHICGRWKKQLANHALYAHRVSPAEYRAIFGLNRVNTIGELSVVGFQLPVGGWGSGNWQLATES